MFLLQCSNTWHNGIKHNKIKLFLFVYFSKSIWPDGVLAVSSPERDHNTKMRTRLVAKMLLFCAIPGKLLNSVKLKNKCMKIIICFVLSWMYLKILCYECSRLCKIHIYIACSSLPGIKQWKLHLIIKLIINEIWCHFQYKGF